MKPTRRFNLTGSAFRVAALLGPSTRALSPRAISVALLAAMVLVGMALWSTPAYAEEPAEPVWSADMTVVEYSSVSMGAASADLFSNVGGSGDLQIKSLWSHIPGRDLRLAFQEGVPNAADYTLQVGGLSLEFPEGSSGDSNFKWNDVDVHWADGQIIHVRIVPTSEIEAQPANTPATGVPTISGMAQVGETLTADTSGIADEDGLDSVSYNYQWIRIDANIADATDSTYTLTDDDQGKTIKLKVSFIDDKGNSETLTSAATAEVSNRPQFLVSNLGVGVEGAGGIQRTLSAARSGFAQAFTTGASTNGYAIGAVDIQMSNFFDASNVGDQLRVTINGVASGGGPGDAHCTLTNPSTFTDLSVITFEAPTGADSCQQLAAETTYFVVIEWISPTGTDSFAVIPQTYPTKKSAATAEDAGGAEGWSIADESYYLAVSSDARTWTAYDETASFKIQVKEGAVTAAKANTAPTGLPTISGTPQVEQTLTADTSAITDEDGLENVSYSYQWIRSDNGADTDIAGETDSTYTLVFADLGKTIKVQVTFTDDDDNAETLTSVAAEAVAASPNRAATGAPTISGTPQVGQTLTAGTSDIADEDGLENVSYSYQWTAGGSDIDGATGSSYTLTSSEQGQTVQVRVTFTDDADNAESLTSEATVAVAAKPNSEPTGLLTISGTAQVGQKLTADTSGITDADGLTNVSYSYQWIRNDGTNDAHIGGQTGSTYTLTDEDVGKTIKVRVSFTDDAGNEETLTSAATAAVAARPNTPATGLPTISGTAQAGKTLTADTSGIADEDGLDNATFTYQWLADDANIDGATDSRYTLTSSDEGKAIKVKVSFTDDANNEETLTSAATAAVAPQSDNTVADEAVPVWSADMLVVEYSSVSIGAASADLFSNVGGSAGLQVKSLWSYTLGRDLRLAFTDGVPGAEDMTLQVGDLALAFPAGSSGASRFKWNDVDVDWEDGQTISVRIVPTSATATVPPNTPATGLPTISGKAQVEERLTADTSGIADADGLTNVSYSYQWIRSDNGTDANIAGQTDSTYTLVAADRGKAIKVKVSFTDDADHEETLTSAATGVVAAKPNTPATGAPTISGTAQVGETLTALTNGITDADGLTSPTYSYQWLAANVEIAGATNSTYTLSDEDEGKAIKVKVSFTDDADHEETLTSAATGVVAAKPNSPATGAPVITGTAQVDETLTADVSSISDADGLTNVSYSYQWIAGGSDINGATGSSHTLTTSEQGRAVQVRVSFTDDGGNEETLTSAAMAAVAAKPNTPATGAPTISGTAHPGETLTADTADIADGDGLDNATFSYQWITKDGNADTDIAGETGSTYEVSDDDVGKTVKVRVSFTDDRNNEETLTSVTTAAVVAKPNNPATGAPTVTGTAQVGQTLTAGTSGIADEDGLKNVSYRYQWTAGGSDIDGATGSSYTLTSSEQGQTVQVRVTFTDDADNAESLTSVATAAVEARPNTPATGAPAISGTPQVGETLIASTSGVADRDGLTNVSYSYQWIAGGSDIAGATNSTYTLADSDLGKAIQVRVSFEDDAGNAESLTSVATTAVAPRPPLTATFAGRPSTHDGQTAFTFELRFSEEFGISYVTLRDHAFSVTGGTVNKAKRMTQGSNIGWTITVTPDSPADVTVVLPVTTDCEDEGVVCTGDGRKLSNRLVFTVSGRGG